MNSSGLEAHTKRLALRETHWFTWTKQRLRIFYYYYFIACKLLNVCVFGLFYIRLFNFKNHHLRWFIDFTCKQTICSIRCNILLGTFFKSKYNWIKGVRNEILSLFLVLLKKITFIFMYMRALSELSLYTMFKPHACESQKIKSHKIIK